MNATPPRTGTPRRFDVAVQGAGVVGQTLALLLARDRLRVALVGQPRDTITPDVRAYALNSASREVLRSVRAWPETDDSGPQPGAITPVNAMQVWGDDGGELNFSASDQSSDALTWIVDVPALEQRLSDAVGFQGSIERLTETPAAALTVVCEGKRSQTREQLGLA
ncbi:MAG: ubiquinone biosynthesis protein UbiH, partial [Hydrogenophaga sp.]|nr:ubiquinone biosynthesis protein UbiH [Hydrogenophaga sp.]